MTTGCESLGSSELPEGDLVNPKYYRKLETQENETDVLVNDDELRVPLRRGHLYSFLMQVFISNRLNGLGAAGVFVCLFDVPAGATLRWQSPNQNNDRASEESEGLSLASGGAGVGSASGVYAAIINGTFDATDMTASLSSAIFQFRRFDGGADGDAVQVLAGSYIELLKIS